MSGPKGGERQQHAAAVMEGLLHTEHNNTIVIWDLPNALTPPCALPSFFHLPLLCTYITLKKDFCRELQNVLKDRLSSPAKPEVQDKTELQLLLSNMLFSS